MTNLLTLEDDIFNQLALQKDLEEAGATVEIK